MRGKPTVYLLTPTSEWAKEWVKTNVGCESRQLAEDGVAIEARYIQDTIDGMTAAGFEQHLDFDVKP
jgi:hypothetical protein